MAITIEACAVVGERATAMLGAQTPDLRADEALVKVRAVALCTLEQRVFRGGLKVPLPFVGGHEVSGEIAALGDGANPKMLKVGGRVAVRLLHNCGECYYCRTGHTNLCVQAQKKPVREGLYPGPGGLCDYIVVRTSALFPIADALTFEEASLTEPLACCVHSVERAESGFGQDVLVVGGGIMGQMHCMLAKLRGARVILSETDETRRALGLAHGADVAVDPASQDLEEVIRGLTDGRGADVAINTTAIPEVFAQTLHVIGKTGRLVQYSSMHPDGPAPVSPQMLHSSEMVLTGSISPDEVDFFKANRLLNLGIVSVRKLISAAYPLREAQAAFLHAIVPNTFRTIVTD
ncbi:MAG TPA: alcohol dehydrogenase catalytic domain-containing protein [Candidatus Limnocylindria bacterium]|nr:alcohol dehydrogenase catalytic domain-containing protein [Candidatus Limnocylindria bacterium]